MHKRLISFFLVFSFLLSLFSVSAFADDAHQHTFENKREYDLTNLPDGYQIPFTVYEAPCSGGCGYSEYSWNIFGISGKFVDKTGTPALTVYKHYREWFESTYGKNASAQIIDASNAGANIPAPGGRNPKGYGDEGKADVNASGVGCIWVEPFGISNAGEGFSKKAPSSCITGSSPSGTSFPFSDGYIRCTYYFKAPFTGLYYVGSFGNPFDVGTASLFYGGKWNLFGKPKTFDSVYYRSISLNKGDECYYTYCFVTRVNASGAPFRSYLNKIPIFVDPLADSSITATNNITINNNTWNGNIYTDNSTNLTYIYPQYTTINEKNETVTNISNTPIIYNNETKQYYTYDQTTKNYYYITYNAPSPSPTPAPTEKPGGSISTPETGKPGGDTGDTTGILAVLVEIRDNMIQGFLDIKAAFVAGFAELSANFTLAIENLNVNIQNTFNKKFPDQSTPETAQPTPTPSPEPTETPLPTDPPSPTPSPSPAPTGKPDGGGDTNNFWNIFISGGSDDGTDGDHKGIFWALVSLILALIAFFTNLFAGVAYLFPFLPEGVVMTLNTCLFVVFLFVIIKFIMRSK